MTGPLARFRPTRQTAVIAICWRCEFEWDADRFPADMACPDCTATSGGSEDHTVARASDFGDEALAAYDKQGDTK